MENIRTETAEADRRLSGSCVYHQRGIGGWRNQTTARGGGGLSAMLDKRRRWQATCRCKRTFYDGNGRYRTLGSGEPLGGTSYRRGGRLFALLGSRSR